MSETLALRPRVLLAHNVTTAEDAAAMIADAGSQMQRSPEKHYSPGFENYRTSTTAGLSDRRRPAARRIRDI